VGVLLLVAGVFFLWGSYQAFDPSDVVCDGQRMGPGDECISTQASKNGTYEEIVARQVESERSKPRQRPYLVIAIVVGAGLVVGTTIAGRRAQQQRTENRPEQ